jgi:hypothetical protein
VLPGFADQHFKRPIALGLRQRGMDVVIVQERGLCMTDDEVLLGMATAEGRLMLTNDEDFLAIHARWQSAGRTHAGIIYWHQDKYPIGEAIRQVLGYVMNTAAVDAANKVHYL